MYWYRFEVEIFNRYRYRFNMSLGHWFHTYIPLYQYTYISMISVYTYYRYLFDLNPETDIGISDINSGRKCRYRYWFAVYRYDFIGPTLAPWPGRGFSLFF